MASIAKDSEVQSLRTGTATRPEGGTVRSQPVALEVPVSVNGARTVEGSDKREPFSETTKTVLIFVNGAVIRLSSTVAPGQLLFLTNENTKKEVVCQVVKSKNYRSVSGYVELEFTEPAVGFWGMRFPTERAISAQPRNSVAPAAPANLSPATTKTVFSESAAVPGAARPAAPQGASPAAGTQSPARPAADPDTEALRLEAARLQEQLSGLLFTQKAGSKAPAQPAKPEVPAAPETKAPEAKAKVIEMAHRPEAAPAEAASQPVNLSAPPAETTAPAARKSALDLAAEEVKIPAWLEPLARNSASPAIEAPLHAEPEIVEVAAVPEESTDASVSAFPSDGPATTFGSQLLLGEEETGTGAPSERSGSGKGILIGLLAAGIIAAAAGGAWYFGFRHPANAEAQTNAPTFATLPPAERTSAANTQSAFGTPQPNSTTSNSTAAPATSPAGAETLRSAAAGKLPSAVNAKESEKVDSSRAAAEVRPPAEKTTEQPKKPALGKVQLVAPLVNAKSAPVEDVAAPHLNGSLAAGADPVNAGLIGGSNQPVVPQEVGGDVKTARLLHSVPPVYPSLARTQRVSGDIKIDALVDATGHVTTMKVVSGPVLLHQAAMDALRQWRYQPAMLDGKPVPMHLAVTVQFRLQ